MDLTTYHFSMLRYQLRIHIGADARISANAVVLTDIPSRVMAAGIPARIVKKAAREHAVADGREY